MYEVFDDTAARVLLGLDSGDSIRRVAQRIDVPYETVRQAVNRLEAAGILDYDSGLYLPEPEIREHALALAASAARSSEPTIEEAYVLPHFAGLPFAFTRIDAVYVWTQGGYQIARNPDDYPLFIAVQDDDVDNWYEFFDRFGLPAADERQPESDVDGALQFVIEPRAGLEVETVEGHPVIPRSDTIDYMEENYAAFESALSMLDRMYDDVSLDVAYRETERAQS